MKSIRLTPAAREDLAAIRAYTRRRWGLAQAETYLRGLGARFQGLRDGDPIWQSADHVRPGYRRCAYRSHMIYYVEDDRSVDVMRVLHQAMDVETHLG